MNVQALPLSAGAFEPFGCVLVAPAVAGRDYFDAGLGTTRASMRPSVSITHTPATSLPFRVEMLERHAYSSQTFVPLDASRWLVIVAPPDADGGPDSSRLRAFVAGPEVGITLSIGTWHHGLTVLDRAARFAIFMWRDGTAADEEFVRLDAPVAITVEPIVPEPRP